LPILELSTKELVTESESTAEHIFDFLGLKSEPVELPHKNKTCHTPVWWRDVVECKKTGLDAILGDWKHNMGNLVRPSHCSAKQVKIE
jgi:hypothetical protein